MSDFPSYWFISDPFHSLFFRTTVAVSIISNAVLIFTIKTTTTLRMGKYRYLLLCFAIGDMISSLCHWWVSPIVHATDHGFFYFPKGANDLKSEGAILGKAVCLFYIMMYYETLNILAYHFIYRYRVIVRGRFQEWTASWRLRRWVTLAIVFMIAHGLVMAWANAFSSLTNDYSLSLDSSLLIRLYGVNTSDPTIGYVVVQFKRPNLVTGVEEFHGPTMLTFAIIMAGFGLSVNVMVFCSVRIIDSLKGINNSTARKGQQRMLFRALLIQTLVPCIFSYIPVSLIWLLPLFSGIAMGAYANLLMMTTTIFPSLDAIFIIIFIPAYRTAVMKVVLDWIRTAELANVSNISVSTKVK